MDQLLTLAERLPAVLWNQSASASRRARTAKDLSADESQASGGSSIEMSSKERRAEVLAACDAGEGTPAVALRFQIRASWVRRVKQERRVTGKITPATTRKRILQWRGLEPGPSNCGRRPEAGCWVPSPNTNAVTTSIIVATARVHVKALWSIRCRIETLHHSCLAVGNRCR